MIKREGIVRTTYPCPCGKGYIEEIEDYTPGHRDCDAFLVCPVCNKQYEIDFGTSQLHWKLVKKQANENKEGAMNNLAVKTFRILRDLFFDDTGSPILFPLREKRNTQDDPFDEYISQTLATRLLPYGIACQKSSGPLISPDMAVYRLGIDSSIEAVMKSPDNIIGIEVKKLERGDNGKIARATGMDYNSTPPCGYVRVYSADDKPQIVKGFYLFACLEEHQNGRFFVSTMCLCDGSILNDDFDLYMQITGSREKGINLGTYGDGANRNRPMLIFSNPLGASILDRKITLISGLDIGAPVDNIKLAWRFIRKDTEEKDHEFFTYMDARDLAPDHQATTVREPFPVPQKRVSETQGRGKFRLTI